jgi:hypothetical protein
MRIRMGKKIGIVAAICAAAAAGISITAGVNHHNHKSETVTDVEALFGRENPADDALEGKDGRDPGATEGVSIADALGTEAGAAAGTLMPGADDGASPSAQDTQQQDGKKEEKKEDGSTKDTAAGTATGSGTAQGQDVAPEGYEVVYYETVPGQPQYVTERRAVTGTKTVIVPEDHGEMSYSWGISEERVGGVNALPGVVGAITPFTPDSEGSVGDVSFDMPDIKEEGVQLLDEEIIIEEKADALEAAENAQRNTWGNVQGMDITGDHVNEGQDVFIVFE